MTRRRRVPLMLRVCIGVCLLLFSTIATDTEKGLPINPEKIQTTSTSESAFEESKATLNNEHSRKVSELSSSTNEKGAIHSYNITKKDFETVHSEVNKNAKAVDEENVPIPMDSDADEQETRSPDEVDRLSTSNSTNSLSRYNDSFYGTSGKSSSTKTISEDVSRLSRTNDLTTATTKPVLEESRFDDKKNKTFPGNDRNHGKENKTAKLIENSTEAREEYEADKKAEFRYLSKESNVNSVLRSTHEFTTQKTYPLESFYERRKKAEGLSVKNSEVPDLKETSDRKENEGSISLINDTYINYSHYYKTTTEKSLEASLGNQSRAYENATNFVWENGAVTHETQDPKREVEVVGNVTHGAVERISQKLPENSPMRDAKTHELNQRSNENTDSIYNTTKVVGALEKGQLNEENQQKVGEATSEKLSSEGTSSLVPKGRTIGFSGINEFPNLETKPTLSSKAEMFNGSTDKIVEQKPYPYLKLPVQNQLRNSSDNAESTTEDASALENTISRGHLEEKYIDTEPSVVIENSIQQVKPSISENVINGTISNATTQPRSPISMTTMSLVILDEARPTNQTAADKSNDLNTIAKSEEKSKSTGNDISQGHESHGVITEKGNFDVTGNAITEVSLKAEGSNEQNYGPSFRGITNRTTIATLTTEPTDKSQTDSKMFSSADVQTNAEGSLLTRSTLNVTELSEEFLIKGNFSSIEKSPISITSPMDIATTNVPESSVAFSTTPAEDTSTVNVTEAPEAPDANGTNEIPSGGSGTFDPNETFVPSTTTIEYEFGGLSETTTVISQNSTENLPETAKSQNDTFTTILPIQDFFTKSPTDETTPFTTEMTTDSSFFTVETEVASTVDGISSASVTDQTMIPTSIPSLTTEILGEMTTQPGIVEEKTEQTFMKEDNGQKTRDVTEPWTTEANTDAATTVQNEDSTSTSITKDSVIILNITEAPTSVANVNILTDTTQIATSTPSVPTIVRPRTPVSSNPNTQIASNIPIEPTDDTKMSSPSEEITSLVRIVVEGTWRDVCAQKENLKSTLAKMLWLGMNKSVDAKQIRFHQDIPCREPPSSTPASSDMPLTSIMVYVVDENEKFNSTMTNILPTLYQEFRDRLTFPIVIHSFRPVQETIPASGNVIAVIVVSSVAFLCLVLLAGLLFIMRKRQTRFNYGERCRPVSLDAYSLDSVSAYNSVRRKGVARSSKRSYGNPTFEDSSAIPSHPLNFAGLSSFCNDVNAINEEFTGIPQVSAKIDELPAGAEVNNRYANVIPLPETRVPLQKINNDPLSEYINASYVRGPKNATRYYIACQAPMESTVTDFWRMIWEQQCKVIIMLTDLVENGVEKCTEYIPPSEITDCHRLYGDYQVTLKKRETKEKYAISTLHLKNLENNTFREVYHIWYLWPVNGVQSDGAGLIAVLLEARALQRGGPGPIVVHCSPGTGRTGTLIALDLGIRQYEITRTVDVPRVVYTIRRDRAGAVQTKEQYAFIYKALNLYATKLAGGVLEST